MPSRSRSVKKAAPPRVLLSASCIEQLRDPVADALGAPDAVQLLALESIVGDESELVDAAFISRDITGTSTKHVHTSVLRDCHAVLRRSPQLSWVHTHSA